MQILFTADQMRNLDRITIEQIGIPGIVLMEHAGHKTALIIKELFDYSTRTLIVCGKGNNGGDGFVIARWLSHWGWPVKVVLLTSVDRLRGDARVNAEIFSRMYPEKLVESEDIGAIKRMVDESDLIVDAILGTGINSPVSGFYKEVIELLNSSGKTIFSVDIPSGLFSDTGAVKGLCVKADYTATYGGLKRAFFVYPARDFVGEVFLVDIGIPESIKKGSCFLIEESDVASIFKLRDRDTHKGHYGHLAVITGSPGKTGAGIMTGESALRVGAGLVTLVVPESLNIIYEASTLEVMSKPVPDVKGFISRAAIDPILGFIEDKDAIALGPGLGTHEETFDVLKELILKSDVPMVIDADGINLIAKDPGILKHKRAEVILTPHPGELSRLVGISARDINLNRLEIAEKVANEFEIILVLKGASTVIADYKNGHTFVNATGNPGMASGGSGDVLTGIISGLVAQGVDPLVASYAGVFLHGLCGDVASYETGEYALCASDIIDAILQVISSWEKGDRLWKGVYRSL